MKNLNELLEGEKPVLVDFFATWCEPCRSMHPVLEKLKREVGDRIRIIKIDIDSPGNRKLTELYNVRSVPTLLFFREGKVVWRQAGVVEIDILRQIAGI